MNNTNTYGTSRKSEQRVGKNNKQQKVMKTKQLILLVAFLGMFSNIQAQDATLEETLEFIKLRTIGQKITSVYQPFAREYEKVYIEVFSLSDKMIYIGSCTANYLNGVNSTEWKYYIDLTKIRTIALGSDGTSFFFRPENIMYIIETNYPSNFIDKKYSSLYLDYGADAPRVLKAYKHLLDLLGIKLMEEKF